MKKNIYKLLVLVTLSIVCIVSFTIFWIEIAHPKNIDLKNGLSFGNKNSLIKLVVFEDFNCKTCKKFSEEFLPSIKEKYIDSNVISYTIIPIAIVYNSIPISNAAIIIYEMTKEGFFEFLKIISNDNAKIETKEDLIEIAKTIKGVNIEVFKEFLNNEVYNNYLQENYEYAKKIVKPIQVPTIYLNGHSIKMDRIYNKIEELISYKEKNETISR